MASTETSYFFRLGPTNKNVGKVCGGCGKPQLVGDTVTKVGGKIQHGDCDNPTRDPKELRRAG